MQKIKKISILLIIAIVGFTTSCTQEPLVTLQDVSVQLVLPEGVESSLENVTVTLRSDGIEFKSTTNAEGLATYEVPAGIYEASAYTIVPGDENKAISLNGLKSGIAVTQEWENTPVSVELVASVASQVIIKEVYIGGCIDAEDPTDHYQFDCYVTLYNNSSVVATLDDLVLASTGGNAHANDWNNEGLLLYENEDWLPVNHGLWYFPNEVVIEPYSEIVIAVNGGIDHIAGGQVNSVDLSNADYVCYDPECGYNHKYYYPAPSEKISPDRYLKGARFGLGNGWMLSVTCASFFIFSPEGMTPAEFVADESLTTYPPGWEGFKVFAAKKAKQSWVIDAVDIFCMGMFSDDDTKRFPASIDAGYVRKDRKGWTVYRNVNKEATEAIEGNTISYGYYDGTIDKTGGTTDPSGINAEETIKNGGKIIFMDSNNSTNDFHARREAALRYNL